MASFVSKSNVAVHKWTTNDYQRFVNAFVFVNNIRRQKAVEKTQIKWKDCDSKTDHDDIKTVFELAIGLLQLGVT